MAKPKVSSDWLAGCAGCHMSLLDMDERIATVISLVDLRATPITDLKHPDESGVDVGILEGGITILLMKKSLCACAHAARF
jgi:NAD-reducing hydrogenase small subunit